MAKPAAQQTAASRRRTELVLVPGALSHGPDRVQRIVDPIEQLYARRRIDSRQKAAAERYRRAFENCSGHLASPLAAEAHERGGSGASFAGSACLVLDDAMTLLGPLDEELVGLVAGMGLMIGDAAKVRLGVSRRAAEECGDRLRRALRILADRWFPARRPSISGSSFRASDARPTSLVAGMLPAPRTAHASRYRVRYA